MPNDQTVTILCLASYFKGARFMEACKELGARVILITKEKLADEPWPHHALDGFYKMPNISKQPDITNAVSYLARSTEIDQVIALDEYDTQTASDLREHLRGRGMGASTARFFRDKLAMRVKAREEGLPVPDFVHVLNYDDLRAFMDRVPAPWVLKPRSEASAMGIKKIHEPEQLWRHLDQLGDRQSHFLMEQFLPGDVFHVDSIVEDGDVMFAAANGYVRPPMTIYQGGGVFGTRTLDPNDAETKKLLAANQRLIERFGFVRGTTHAEFIRGAADGEYYFLEVAARVGGANIDLIVEHATGVSLWDEWAKVEINYLRAERYEAPQPKRGFAGLLTCLAQQQYPDLSSYDAPEVVWKLHKEHHAGLIVAADTYERVTELLNHYTERFHHDFLATEPPLDEAPD